MKSVCPQIPSLINRLVTFGMLLRESPHKQVTREHIINGAKQYHSIADVTDDFVSIHWNDEIQSEWIKKFQLAQYERSIPLLTFAQRWFNFMTESKYHEMATKQMIINTIYYKLPAAVKGITGGVNPEDEHTLYRIIQRYQLIADKSNSASTTKTRTTTTTTRG